MKSFRGISNVTARMVKDELIDRFEENGYKTTPIVVNGYYFEVTPCVDYGTTPSGLDDVDFFLVDGILPWLSSRDFDVVCRDIANIKNLVDENEREKKRLNDYFVAHKDEPKEKWYDFYSDWYKDVYGHRPR